MTSPYQQIFDAIELGDLKPGDRLRETDLADRFAVSRTPIREAIRKLESEGIVVHAPRVGAVVRQLGQQEIVELYEMRIVLETTAARLAAKHASAAEIRSLEQLNASMTDAADTPALVAALNRKFHSCILQAARNQFLADSYRSLSHALILLGRTTLETDERVATVVAQHHDIILALSAGDGAAAANMMQSHMETSLDHRLKGLHVVA
ncbi:MAG: GntR family transcriptional regulator [Pseudomonadota bacterium]